jgi:acyl-CoA synthetase (AMP-forming)/AMP-acid ligase II
VSASLIGEQFEKLCRDAPSRVAVRNLTVDRAWTFSQLLDDSVAVRSALRELAVSPGTSVVTLLGNRPLFFSALVACMNAGAAMLPLGDATDAAAATLIQESGATIVIADRQLPVRSIKTHPLPEGARMFKLTETSEAPGGGQAGRRVVLKLTSGSTDFPKAAIASEQHLVNDGRHIIDAMGIESSDVNFGCIPLSHSYALGNIVMPLLLQGTGVVLRQTFSPSQFVEDLTESGATVFPGVPFMFDRLIGLHLPRTLRLLITAGARIDSATVRWFHQNLGRKVHSFYGSSETGGIAYDASNDVSDDEPEPLHVGTPMPETSISFVPTKGNGAERSGSRILVSGNAVAAGYAGGISSSPAEAPAFRDDGFLTGDLGHFDAKGRLVLTGRVTPVVNVAGRKVDPAEVEAVLLGLDGIAQARVLGMPCDTRGQQLVAFVVVRDHELTPLGLRQLCSTTLSAYKIPRRFVFLDRFPVDARGKMDRHALEALATDLT